MTPEIQMEIDALLKKSDRKLQAAKENLKGKFFEDAISRAYYGCYHAAQALLLTKNLRARSHRGLKNLLGLHLIQTGELEREYALLLDSLQNSRENSDYEIFIDATKEEAEEAIAATERFVRRARLFLNR